MKKVALLISTLTILGCSKPPHKCSDQSTIEILKDIIREHLPEPYAGLDSAFAKSEFDRLTSVKLIAPSDYNESIKKFSCTGTLEIEVPKQITAEQIANAISVSEHDFEEVWKNYFNKASNKLELKVEYSTLPNDQNEQLVSAQRLPETLGKVVGYLISMKSTKTEPEAAAKQTPTEIVPPAEIVVEKPTVQEKKAGANVDKSALSLPPGFPPELAEYFKDSIKDPLLIKAMELAKQGNSDGLVYLKTSAENGNSLAQFMIAAVLVDKDDTQAAYWFRKVADSGMPLAQTMMGSLYFQGKGVEKNEVEAASWILKAAEQGYPNAEFFAGGMYQEGKGVEMNIEQAKSWYQKAAKHGNADAKKALDALLGHN